MYVKGPTFIDRNAIRSVLLIQLGDIGDVLYTFPCARAIKESIPGVKVVLAVRQKALGLARKCPWADKIIGVQKENGLSLGRIFRQLAFWRQLRANSFDLAIDLRSGTRGALMALLSGAPRRLARWAADGALWRNRLFTHLYLPPGRKNQYIVEYLLDILIPYEIRTAYLIPEFHLEDKELQEAKKILRGNGIPFKRPIFALQPYSLWKYKEWSEENCRALMDLLTADLGFDVIITGSPDESRRALALCDPPPPGVCNIVGKTPIDLLPAIFRLCTFFLGVDSAGLHIAAAAGTPTFALYGPSSPETWAPRGEQHRVIRKKWPCVPCGNTGCEGNMQSRCMAEITVSEVYEIIRKSIIEINKEIKNSS